MNTPFKNTKVTLGLALGAVISTSVLAQSGSLRSEYSDLADLYNALDVTQAGIYDAMADINASPDSQEGRMELKMHLDMMAEACLLYTSPSPRDRSVSRMPSSA